MELNGAKQDILRDYVEPKATGIRGRITRAFDDDEPPRIVRGIHESGLARSQVAVGADGITTKGSRKQFRDASLPLESNTVNSTRNLVFVGSMSSRIQPTQR